MIMYHDPITEEIRELRHQLAERFDNDIDRIGEDLRRREAESGRRIVRRPKRAPRPTAVQTPQPSDEEAAAGTIASAVG